jgi:uncharacterized protein YjeT (DUF2065 family)
MRVVFMWQQILIGLSLVLVIEGMMPFLNPRGMKKLMETMSSMDDRALRVSGFISMMLGIILLYIVN